MFSSNLQKLMREALLNNTYDKPSMDKALITTLEKSYNYLYSIQKQYVGFEQRNYYTGGLVNRRDPIKPGQLYLNKAGYACIDIDFDIITTASMERFRRSCYYENEFDLNDMIDHPEIFTYIPVIMIDGMVIHDWKVSVTNLVKTCSFRFTTKRMDFVLHNKRKFQLEHPEYLNDNDVNDYDSIIYKEHRIDAFIIENEARTTTYIGNLSVMLGTIKETYTNRSHIVFSQSFIRSLADKYADPSKGMFFLTLNIHTESEIKERNPDDYFLLIPSSNNDVTDNQWTFLLPHKLESILEYYQKSTIIIKPYYLKNIHIYKHHTYKEFILDTASIAESNITSVDSYSVRVRDGNTSFMVVEKSDCVPYDMPIPKQNFMIFREKYLNTSNEYFSSTMDIILLNNNDCIIEHYPNIYELNTTKDSINSENDSIWSFYFYRELDELKYTPLHDWYYKFLYKKFNIPLEELITRIFNNDLPDLNNFNIAKNESFKKTFEDILNFKQYKHQYGEIDFLCNYKILEENIKKLPFEYKVETLRKWVTYDPFVLKKYVLEQNRISQIYHVFVNTIDLSKRIRTDDSLEAHGNTTFATNHYVFALSNNKINNNDCIDCRVFVDGLFIHDVHQIRYMSLDYLYIPCQYISDNSYIEVEVFPSYSFSKDVVFNSIDDEKRIVLTEPDMNIFPTKADLLARDSSGIEYDDSVFDIVSVYREGEYDISSCPKISQTFTLFSELKSFCINNLQEKDNSYYFCEETNRIYFIKDNDVYDMGDYSKLKSVEFTRIRDIKIKPKYDDIVGKELSIRISKVPHGFPIVLNKDGYPCITIESEAFKYQPDYIRIFKNGRLLSSNRYTFFTNSNKEGVSPQIQILEKCYTTDLLYLDITPFSYKQVYYQDELHENDLFVDLSGVITKPYDPRYYDCYINGRRASLNNIIPITPWVITFVNLQSIYSIEIFEKERDWEYFGLDYSENIYGFTPITMVNEDFMSEDDKKNLIYQIIQQVKEPDLVINPNTNDEEKMDNTDLRIYLEIKQFYFDELIPKKFLNPDKTQFNHEFLVNNYRSIFDTYAIDPYEDSNHLDRTARYPEVLLLNPDILIESAPEEPVALYSIGHMDEHELNFITEDISNVSEDIHPNINDVMKHPEND